MKADMSCLENMEVGDEGNMGSVLGKVACSRTVEVMSVALRIGEVHLVIVPGIVVHGASVARKDQGAIAVDARQRVREGHQQEELTVVHSTETVAVTRVALDKLVVVGQGCVRQWVKKEEFACSFESPNQI
jgi:hypothetical protein